MPRSLNPQLFGPIETPIIQIEGEQISSRRMGDIEAQVQIVDQKLERWAQKMEKRFEHITNAQKALSEQIFYQALGEIVEISGACERVSFIHINKLEEVSEVRL